MLLHRYQQTLTLDVIMSAVFGVKTDCQTNPDDPVLAKALLAMSQTMTQKILFPIMGLLPFGKLLMDTEYFGKLLFGNLFPMMKVAQEMIDVKRKGEATGRKVCTLIFPEQTPRKKWETGKKNCYKTLNQIKCKILVVLSLTFV